MTRLEKTLINSPATACTRKQQIHQHTSQNGACKASISSPKQQNRLLVQRQQQDTSSKKQRTYIVFRIDVVVIVIVLLLLLCLLLGLFLGFLIVLIDSIENSRRSMGRTSCGLLACAGVGERRAHVALAVSIHVCIHV